MNCIYCGSDRLVSQGRSMKCKSCGRIFSKIRRRVSIPAKDRPPCPDCGSLNPYSCGFPGGIKTWSCKSCGRYYSAVPKEDKVELSIMEVQVE